MANFQFLGCNRVQNYSIKYAISNFKPFQLLKRAKFQEFLNLMLKMLEGNVILAADSK